LPVIEPRPIPRVASHKIPASRTTRRIPHYKNRLVVDSIRYMERTFESDLTFSLASSNGSIFKRSKLGRNLADLHASPIPALSRIRLSAVGSRHPVYMTGITARPPVFVLSHPCPRFTTDPPSNSNCVSHQPGARIPSPPLVLKNLSPPKSAPLTSSDVARPTSPAPISFTNRRRPIASPSVK
jgi:hypothetical protein